MTPHATTAVTLVRQLQGALVERLGAVSVLAGPPDAFATIEWLRGGGEYGGGDRRTVAATPTFDRASVNVSAIHYETRPDKALGSATALSAIVHPAHPHAPSMHTHISWTEMKDGRGYWRIMADLNPAIPDPRATGQFRQALAQAAGAHFEGGTAQGDRYFYIPALGRHRGVVHFYLEAFHSGDFDADAALAARFGRTVITTYGGILEAALSPAKAVSEADRQAQVAYHTLYFFQVLTLDRGTTSGLLVHNENDVGILGSLPSKVDRDLLRSWREALPEVQRPLLDGLVHALEDGGISQVTEAKKRRLAEVVRQHYRANPSALALQARGDVVPPTVANHRG